MNSATQQEELYHSTMHNYEGNLVSELLWPLHVVPYLTVCDTHLTSKSSAGFVFFARQAFHAALVVLTLYIVNTVGAYIQSHDFLAVSRMQRCILYQRYWLAAPRE